MTMTHVDRNENNNPNDNRNILVTGVSKSALRWLAAGLSLILFTAIIGLSYSIGVGDAEKGAIPIIRADGTAVKVRPENPGGRKYPHQDLTIYNSFRDDISEKDMQLKDTLEKPVAFLDNEQTATESVTDISQNEPIKDTIDTTDTNNDATDTTDTMKLMTVSEITPPDTATKSEQAIKNIVKQSASVEAETVKPKPAVPVKSTVTEKLIAQKSVMTKPQPVVAKAQPASNGNRAYLQIGAFRSQADALSAFKRAKGKFSELSSAGHVIVKADLGSKGVYYRLRVGPFDNKQKSLDVCSRLKAKGQACLYTLQ